MIKSHQPSRLITLVTRITHSAITETAISGRLIDEAISANRSPSRLRTSNTINAISPNATTAKYSLATPTAPASGNTTNASAANKPT